MSSIRPQQKKCLVILLSGLLLGPASAQFEIKKHSINNGAATMASSNFEISASVAQVDASQQMTGKQLALTGGFWTEAVSAQNNDLIFKDDFE